LIPDPGLYLAFRLPKWLKMAGFRVHVFCLRGHPLARSRYVAQTGQFDSEAALLDATVSAIEAWADEGGPKVIVAEETYVRRLSGMLRPEILEKWQPSTASAVGRGLMNDKAGLEAAAKAWGWPVPESENFHDPESLRQAAYRLDYPLIFKPFRESGGAGVVLVRSVSELPAVFAQSIFPLVAQRFIEGPSGICEMLCRDGKVLAWLTSYKYRTNGRFGPSISRRFQHLATQAPLVAQIASDSRHDGFCGFDWVEEASSGRRWLIEFHPRTTYGWRFAGACGVDLAGALRKYLSPTGDFGLPVTYEGTHPLICHQFTASLFYALRHGDWPILRDWLFPSRRHDVYLLDDPRLFFAFLWSRLFRAKIQ
jgi:hypothetical protein